MGRVFARDAHAAGQGFFYAHGDLPRRKGDGIAYVKLGEKFIPARREHAEIAGERAAHLVAKGAVKPAAVQGAELFEAGKLGRDARKGAQYLMRRVFAQLRRGAVRGLARGGQKIAAAYFLRAYLARKDRDVRERPARVHDHVDPLAPSYREQVLRQRQFEAQMQDTLFAGDDGEVRVGRKALLRPDVLLRIALGALPAALFVAAREKAYLAAGDKALRFELSRGEEAAKQGTLVVHHAPAVDDAVAYLPEGRMRPALAEGDGVEMTENGERLALAHVSGDVISLFVMRVIAQRPRRFLKERERFPHALAEGRERAGRVLHALYRQKPHERLLHLLKTVHKKPPCAAAERGGG